MHFFVSILNTLFYSPPLPLHVQFFAVYYG